MERSYEWQIGQRVKMKDPDDGVMVYGNVTDKTSVTVFIKWDDLREPVEHDQSEYGDIKLA